MDTDQKVEVLGQSAQYDICASYLCKGDKGRGRTRGPGERWIYPAVLPDGKNVSLLKILMTNACDNDCSYCPNRCSSDVQRASFQPEELAKLFMQMRNQGKVEGLFLSSAISGNAEMMMDRMIGAVEILRERYRFPGYVHLKILPEARFEHVQQAIHLADRVSINLEVPNPDRLMKISESKSFDELLLRMKWIDEVASQERLRSGHTTQFVVGAADESDKEILQTTDRLYRELNLRRAYFSAFQPVEGTPLEDHPPTSLVREHRLYQADFLFRGYGFRLEEIGFDEEGNMPLGKDPKLVWAIKHPERFPVEVNKASYNELIRVPGIGPKSASRIVRTRRKDRFHSLGEVKSTGAVVKHCAPFILIDGRQPEYEYQLEFWDMQTA